MGRYTGPVCRLCRREGMKLFLKGTRCTMAKCPIDTGRPSPGMHASRRSKKLSDYGMQLREKQRLRFFYGLQENQFRLTFERAARTRGVTGEILLQLLESRLDNLVYRMGFALSRRQARMMVTQGHVRVNGRKVDIPSCTVKPGSVISVKDQTRSREAAKRALEVTQSRPALPWISVVATDFAGTFLRVPTREEIAPFVDEQMVVELYSK